MIVSRSTRGTTALILCSFIALSCSDSDVPAPVETNPVAETDVVDSTLALSEDLPEDVTAAGVLLAATLIAAGDIEAAVASGLVSPAEVDEAKAAIEAGTLDRWVALAQGD